MTTAKASLIRHVRQDNAKSPAKIVITLVGVQQLLAGY